MHRRSFIIASAACLGVARAQQRPQVVVYKTPTCGCCGQWVAHLRRAGFFPVTHDMADLSAVKTRAGVPEALRSCHTALVGGYFVEGHVPAEVIARLVTERPSIIGIAVGGMPIGSPGMEAPGSSIEPFDVMAVGRTGPPTVYASYPKGYRQPAG